MPIRRRLRLIDNRTDGGAVEDLRVPVVGGEIPFVYRKHRPFCDRFSNTNLWVGLATAEQVLSEGEQELLRGFCRAMGLDLGELDVLRDAGDTRIYVVDVNPTAWGPPRPLPTAEAIRAVGAYAAALAPGSRSGPRASPRPRARRHGRRRHIRGCRMKAGAGRLRDRRHAPGRDLGLDGDAAGGEVESAVPGPGGSGRGGAGGEPRGEASDGG